MKNLKHLLPVYSILDHLCLDKQTLDDLVICVHELSGEFKSVIQVNKKLCGVHNDLTHSTYKNFFQIALTDTEAVNEEINLEELDLIHNELNKNSIANNIRLKKKLGTDEQSPFNETMFTKKTEIYQKYSLLFDKILSKFKGTPTRMRLVKLEAGSSITPHIDYDPSYAVRIIIPIIADAECINLFWVKNEVIALPFKPGHAYFLNTGYKHAVINYSKNDRYTFMISMKDLSDIEHLIKKI